MELLIFKKHDDGVLITLKEMGLGDGSEIMSAYCYSRGHEFS